MSKSKILEDRVEKNVCDEYDAKGGIAYKFISPGRSGVTDRLGLEPIKNKRHRDIVKKYVKFIECKRPGGKPKPHQINEMEYLNDLGYYTEVVDNLEWKL